MNIVRVSPLPSQSLPPEWAPQRLVMLTWPHVDGDWGEHFPAVEENFYQLAKALSPLVPLLISAPDKAAQERIQQQLPTATVAIIPSNDIWVRDHGPLTVIADQQSILIDAVFDGWGDKYPAALDNKVTSSLHALGHFGSSPIKTCPQVLEGGAIEVDGNGTLMSRLCCLPHRRGVASLESLSQQLGQLLGVRQIAWLEHGALEGDDTDAHIDTLARFLPNNTIVYQGCDDPADSHFTGLQKLGEELRAMKNIDGVPYTVIALPWPEPTFSSQNVRLPVGYANFLICNQTILLPVYGLPQDSAAQAALQQAAPDFRIEAVNCRALVNQYGSLHCATMQIPAESNA